MDNLKQFKEKKINDYISNNLDFTNPNAINTKQIKQELKKLLNEEPGVKLNYRKDDIVVEGGTSKPVETLESISVFFTYESQQYDGKGGYINIPVPVEKEFLIG